MKKIVLISGLIASLIIVGISSLMLWIGGDESSHTYSEWLGYLVMILGLSMIFIGIKQYRDHHLGGVIKFLKGFQVGILITLVATIIYVGAWEFYMQSSDGNFIENYKQNYIETLQKSGKPQQEIAVKIAEMESMSEKYNNPIFRMAITALEIFPVGFIITLISALILRNRRVLANQ